MQVQHEDFADNIPVRKELTDSEQQDAEDLTLKLRRADLYRNQNFAHSPKNC